MSTTFICQNCHQKKSADPCQKGKHRYCDEEACQRARKAAWQRDKMANDPVYHARQKDHQKRWRQKLAAASIPTEISKTESGLCRAES